MPDNLNQQIHDLLVQRDVNILRVLAGTEGEVERRVQELTRELVAALSVSDPTEPVRGTYRQRRLDSVLKDGQGIIRDGYRSLYQEVRRQLLALAAAEVEDFIQTINDSLQVPLMANPLAGSGLRAIIDDRVITANVNDAASFRQFFEREAAAHFKRFEGTLQQGFSQNDTLGQLIRRVKALDNIQQREALSVARTAYNHVQNQTRIEMMQRNANLFRGVIWTSILDDRTTLTCINLSGGMWNLNNGQPLPGSPVQRRFPGPPPIHFACRSHVYPLTKSDSAIGEGSARARRALAELPREQRNLLNIDPPAQETYPEWLKRQPAGVQLKVLGKTRRDLWLQGKLSLRELTTQRGRPLTLRELKRRGAA